MLRCSHCLYSKRNGSLQLRGILERSPAQATKGPTRLEHVTEQLGRTASCAVSSTTTSKQRVA